MGAKIDLKMAYVEDFAYFSVEESASLPEARIGSTQLEITVTGVVTRQLMEDPTGNLHYWTVEVVEEDRKKLFHGLRHYITEAHVERSVLDENGSAHHTTLFFAGNDLNKVSFAESKFGPYEGRVVTIAARAFIKYELLNEDRECGGLLLASIKDEELVCDMNMVKALFCKERLDCEHITYTYPRSLGPQTSNQVAAAYLHHIKALRLFV